MTAPERSGALTTLHRAIRRLVGRGSPEAQDPPADDPARWRRTGEALSAVLALPDAERGRWLEQLGARDATLRREVESLLAAHEREGMLDRGALDAGASARAVLGEWVPGHAGTEVAQYRVLEAIGGGAMGLVYKAWDQRLERTAALKFLPAYLVSDARARERFRVEAQAAAQLDHPNICTIYEAGESADGQFFIAMPFYAGDTLAQRLARGPLPVGEAVALALQAARGLAKAHEHNIIHRDIKPGNLVITADGVLKILDFGIAKLGGTTLTAPGASPGTIAYMSPEQARGEPLDARTDLWSLGVVLYEMLAGTRPFRGDDPAEIAAAIRDVEPEPVSARRSDVPPALDRLVRAAMAKERDARPPAAAAMAAELEAIGALVGMPAGAATRAREERDHAAPPLSVPAEEEKRQVTVVAIVVMGLAELLEQRGAGHAERAMARLRSMVEDVTVRHGGVVSRLDATGAVALFGIPATREDDSLRAARAALALAAASRDAVDGELARRAASMQVRIGIDTGHVIAHQSGDDGSRPEVAGAALDGALRLAAITPPGRIWATRNCRRSIERQLRLEERSPVMVPGLPDLLTPYEIVGESEDRGPFEAGERHGDLTPFTGRDRELGLVLDAIAEAGRGTGRFVTVVGEAGMGKSRLVRELHQQIEGRDITVLWGRCQSHGGGAPYLPFIEVLRDGLRVPAGGSAAERVAAIVARVRDVSPELEELVPLYLHLLSVPSDEHPLPQHLQGEQFRLAAQEAIAAYLTASSRVRLTVLVLEDWHWVDDASHAVLSQVVELAANHALLVLVTCRPGYVADWGSIDPHLSVTLGPLTEASSQALLQSVLHVEDVPPRLAALLHERTGGNPFFLEEVAETLVEDGRLRVSGGRVDITGSLETLHLPDTVQAVIRARLDRLDPRARGIVRVASVIGREFGRDVLERTLGDQAGLPAALHALRTAGLVQQVNILPEARYRFKHVLTQEVAYSSLLEHQRRALHGRVGEAIEALGDPLPDEHLERLAYHFFRAEEWQRAVHYAVRAAERATQLAEFAEAMQLLERARGCLAKLGDDIDRRAALVNILLQQERLSETLGLRDRQQRLIDEMIALLEPDGDAAQLAEVYLRQGDLNTLLQRFDAAEAALQRALAIRRRLADPVGIRNTLRSLGLLRWHQRRDPDALPHIEEALAIDRERGDHAAVVGDLSNLGYVLKGLGRYEEARARLSEALDICNRVLATDADVAARSNLELKRSYLIHNLANVHRALGDEEGGLALLQRAREHVAGKYMPIQLSYHYTSMAHMHLRLGRIDESLEDYRTAVDLTRRANFAPGLSQSLSMLGEVLLALDRDAEALPHLEEAARLFAQLKQHEAEARLWTEIAGVHERAGREPETLAAWGRARGLHRELGDRRGELTAIEGLARATRRHVHDASLALTHYQEAAALAEALEARAIEARVRNIIGILEWERGNYETALDQYRRALTRFRECEDPAGIGLALNSMGAAARALGRREDARRILREALLHNRREQREALLGHTLAQLGAIEMDAAEPAAAAPYFEESLAIRVRRGDTRGEGWMRYELARVAIARAEPGRARDLLAAAARLADACGDAELAESCERRRRTAGL